LTNVAFASRRSAITPSLLPTFADRVIAWQRTHGRHDLPWQDTDDAYRIWLSEIMLQQTQVATVLPYYLRFVAKFPSVEALAASPLDGVLAAWSGLGYYRRAHHLHAAAKIVVERYDAKFPTDAVTLQLLPGIGRSTAAAIAAFASGERGAILDGNVKRVLARHRGVEGWPGHATVEAAMWSIAEALVANLPCVSRGSSRSRDEMTAYTQGLMDVGATICTRARPRCDLCPLADDCVARREARTDQLPSPRPRKALPQRRTTLLLLQRGDEVLLEQRPPHGIWGGLWSFPGVDEQTDIPRHLLARFQATCATARVLPPLTHTFTHFVLTILPMAVPITAWPPMAQTPGVAWFTRDAALVAAIPAPVRKLLRDHC